MTEETKLYRIEEFTTVGWTLIDDKAKKLNKQQASQMLEQYLSLGCNPNALRAIPDNS